ncbi:MAG: hypothetical protein ACUVWX_05400 [Kiritimatiellia bacterium]
MSDIPHITVVGVGNAGCRMVDSLVSTPNVVNREGVAMVAVGTDTRLLRKLGVKVRIYIGKTRTRGEGTGGNAELGRLCAEDDTETLSQLFTQGGLVFLMVGLGGGTGSGAAPVVLDCARKTGAITFCIATIPLECEGPQSQQNAERALAAIRGVTNSLLVVPLEALCEHIGGKNVTDTLAKANRMLASAASCLWRLITHTGYIGLDYGDLREFARRSNGISRLGFADATGRNKAAEVVQTLVESPLLEKGRLVTDAQALLVCIRGGPDLTVKEVGNMMKEIKVKASRAKQISMGTILEEEYRNRIMLTVVSAESWNIGEIALDKEVSSVESNRKAVQPRAPVSAQIQQTLCLETKLRGRFEPDEPTVINGEDLDIPTFIRRGIPIER